MVQPVLSSACDLYAVFFHHLKASSGRMNTVIQPLSPTQQLRNDPLAQCLVRLFEKKTVHPK